MANDRIQELEEGLEYRIALALYHAERNSEEEDSWPTYMANFEEHVKEWVKIQAHLTEEHIGDCTQDSHTCMRCYV